MLVELALAKLFPTLKYHGLPDGDQLLRYLWGSSPYSDHAACPLPDIIILDINMPGLDGFAVLESIQQNCPPLSAPILVLSSSGHERDIRRAKALGAAAYVVKDPGFNGLH